MSHEADSSLTVNYLRQPQRPNHIRLMRRMPPAERTEMQWTHLCRQVEQRHRVIVRISFTTTCLVMLAAVLGLRGWTALLVNPIIAAGFLVDKLTGFQFGFLIALLLTTIIWFAAMTKNYGHVIDATVNEWQKEDSRQDTLEVAAIEEEHMFRDGAETWTWSQRFRSCWIFAGMHAVPWWYGCFFVLFMPFAAGATCMSMYLYTFKKTGSREAALWDAAIVHYRHNRMAYRPLSLFTLIMTVLLAAVGLVLL